MIAEIIGLLLVPVYLAGIAWAACKAARGLESLFYILGRWAWEVFRA